MHMFFDMIKIILQIIVQFLNTGVMIQLDVLMDVQDANLTFLKARYR